MNTREWQRRFFAGPRIWYVIDPEGFPLAFYESKEAAEVELAWRLERREVGYRIVGENIHSMELSVDRWRKREASAYGTPAHQGEDGSE